MNVWKNVWITSVILMVCGLMFGTLFAMPVEGSVQGRQLVGTPDKTTPVEKECPSDFTDEPCDADGGGLDYYYSVAYGEAFGECNDKLLNFPGSCKKTQYQEYLKNSAACEKVKGCTLKSNTKVDACAAACGKVDPDDPDSEWFCFATGAYDVTEYICDRTEPPKPPVRMMYWLGSGWPAPSSGSTGSTKKP